MTTDQLTIPSKTVRASSIPTVQRASGPLGSALRTLPEWVEIVERAAHLEAVRPAHQNMASVEIEIEEKLYEAAEARGSLDLDALTALSTVVRDRFATAQALQTAYDNAHRRYAEDLDNVARQHATKLYRHMSGQLVEIVDQAREAADLVDADAADAVSADRVAEWQTLNALREQFRTVRFGHSVLNQHVGAPIEHFGWSELQWISNPAEVWDEWAPWRADGALVNPANLADRTPLLSPWPDPRTGVQDLADGWFRYLVRTPKAKPWTPTPRQHDDAARVLMPLVAEARELKGNPRRKAGAIR
jgi:hypothetical protein